jgi:hypothetical protein
MEQWLSENVGLVCDIALMGDLMDLVMDRNYL